MGKQIEFYMDYKTQEKFFDFLMSEGMTVLLKNDVKEINIIPEPFSTDWWWSLSVYDKKIGELKIRELDNGKLMIDYIDSSAIEFSRTFINDDEKIIRNGRLWMEMRYYDKDGQLVSKSIEFDNMYKKMVKWIKKNCPRQDIPMYNIIYKEYTSEGIIELLNNGYVIK
jgi:hypothetical protein